MGIYLAVDAGGSKTNYLLADETQVLARVEGPSIKRMRVPADAALSNLTNAFARLESLAGIGLGSVCSTCVGTAGNTVPLVTDWLSQEIGSRVGGSLLIVGDVEIALDAAFPGTHGLLVLAGTGSNVMGRAPNGQVAGAGGYGPVLADQGSGHSVGLRALRAIFRGIDRDEESTLTAAILHHWRLRDIKELVAYANVCAPTQFSALAPIVLACAEAGDRIAREVLELEGRRLAELVIVAHRRLERLQEAAFTPRIACAGSILEHAMPVRLAMIAALQAELDAPEIIDGVVDPVVGALWRARRVT
ncbi:MAG TPA: BadF/BadG/BcrA/BcrD ATPase family protein [Acidobacteriaceae bacterium]|jgi:N-acetylglucosamine kinase-like BadF-type ATPase